MNEVLTSDQARLRSISAALNRIAAGIGTAADARSATALADTGDFPAIPEGQRLGAAWSEARSATAHVTGLLGQATAILGSGVSTARTDYATTDADSSTSIGDYASRRIKA